MWHRDACMDLSAFGHSARARAFLREDGFHQRARWIFFGGIGSALLLPRTTPLFGSVQQAIVLITMCLVGTIFAWACYARPSFRAFPRLVYGLIALLIVSTFVSTILSPDRWQAVLGTGSSLPFSLLTTVLGATVFLCVGRFVVTQEFSWEPTIRRLCLMGVSVSFFLLILQVLHLFESAFRFDALWATFLLFFALFGTLELSSGQSPRRVWTVWGMFLGGLFLFPWVPRFWLFACAGLVFFYAKWVTRVRGTMRFGRVVAMVILASAFPIVGLIKNVPLVSSLELPWSHVSIVADHVIQTNPWLGVGPAQLAVRVEALRDRTLNQGNFFQKTFDQTPASGVTLALERGAIFLLLLLLLLVHMGVCAWKQARAGGEPWRLVAFICACALLALPATFLLQIGFWGLLAVAVAGRYHAKDYERTGEAFMILVCTLLCISASFWIGKRAQAEWEFERGNLASATAHAPWMVGYRLTSLQQRVQLTPLLLAKSTSSDEVRDRLAVLLEEAHALTSRWPQVPSVWLARGHVYALLSAYSEGADQFALSAYQEGLKRAPHHPGFALGMADVYAKRAEKTPIGTGMDAKAMASYRVEQRRLSAEWYRRALAEKPDDPTLAYRFAVESAKAGDIATALPLMESVWRMDPTRSDIRLEYATLLALSQRRSEAIALAGSIGSQDTLYATSRRFLTDWYEAER